MLSEDRKPTSIRRGTGRPPHPLASTGMDRSLSGDLDALGERYKRTHQSGSISTLARGDISKARALLGYDPKWEFREGIREFVKWFGTQ
jgi:nucleoside-diphosphate-sugar epimerase